MRKAPLLAREALDRLRGAPPLTFQDPTSFAPAMLLEMAEPTHIDNRWPHVPCTEVRRNLRGRRSGLEVERAAKRSRPVATTFAGLEATGDRRRMHSAALTPAVTPTTAALPHLHAHAYAADRQRDECRWPHVRTVGPSASQLIRFPAPSTC